MMQNLARGRLLAHGIIARVAPRAAMLAKDLGRKATLAIVAGSDVQSQRFVQIKQHLLAHVPIQLEPFWLDPHSGTAEALALIGELNQRDDVDGIFLQFPLPEAIDPQAVADAVDPEKDIDCSGAIAEEQFEQGSTPFIPVAPAAACQLLEDALGSTANRHVLILGSEDGFARALRLLLQRNNALVRIVSPDETRFEVEDVEALVFSEAQPPAELLSAANRLAVILDAGYYLPPRPAGWLAPAAEDRSCILLKQYGNVGPLTVANLARAAVRAATRRVRH